MQTDFYHKIHTSSAYRQSRDENKNFIYSNPECLKILTAVAFDTKDKNHHKACWILELICEEKMEMFVPFLNDFCKTLPLYISNPAIRSISKICMFLSNSKKIILTPHQEEIIIETCLDWLITERIKVASKMYTIRSLFWLGKKQSWIYEDLRRILAEDFSKHSAAYKAVAKEILKKLGK